MQSFNLCQFKAWLSRSTVAAVLVFVTASGIPDAKAQIQGLPQGWYCVTATPGQYCGGGPRGPFSDPFAGCHEIAVWAQETSTAWACDIVKAHGPEFWGYKLEWHELVMEYSCGVGTTRGFSRCLTCPAGQTMQDDGTCAAQPVCTSPRQMIGGECKIADDVEEPNKDVGDPDCRVGNPCNVSNGNKYQVDVDYTGAGPYPLRAERYYSSKPVRRTNLGSQWRGFYDRTITFATDGTASTADLPPFIVPRVGL